METDQYIGVDLHKSSFQACAVSPRGERQWEGRFARTPEGIAAFVARCTPRSAVDPRHGRRSDAAVRLSGPIGPRSSIGLGEFSGAGSEAARRDRR